MPQRFWEMGDGWEMINASIRRDPQTSANFRQVDRSFLEVNALIGRSEASVVHHLVHHADEPYSSTG
jgi:hypothetical protein